MIRFDIHHLFPKFLLQDKNGYAMAKAIEAGMKYFMDAVQDGIDCVLDPDKMPEWRLDEMAWELSSLYDYTAPIESKRKWIKDAIPLYSVWGTPRSVVEYLSGYFDAIELEEAWQYDGSPFHFRVTLTGEWTDEKEAWARLAISTAKNARSVMDTLAAGAGAHIRISAAMDGCWRLYYPMTGDAQAGTWPQENIIGIIDAGNAQVNAAATPYPFPYTMAGTVPDTATIGALSDGGAEAAADEAAYSIPYKLCGYDDL